MAWFIPIIKYIAVWAVTTGARYLLSGPQQEAQAPPFGQPNFNRDPTDIDAERIVGNNTYQLNPISSIYHNDRARRQFSGVWYIGQIEDADPCGVKSIFIGDRTVKLASPLRDGKAVITDTELAKYLEIWVRTGTVGAEVTSMPRYNTTGDGLAKACYLVLRMKQPDDGSSFWNTGLPRVSVEVRGTVSRNPVTVCEQIVMEDFGKQVDTSSADVAYCDTMIPSTVDNATVMEPRYACDFRFKSTDTLQKLIRNFEISSAGVVYSTLDDKLAFRVGRPRTAESTVIGKDRVRQVDQDQIINSAQSFDTATAIYRMDNGKDVPIKLSSTLEGTRDHRDFGYLSEPGSLSQARRWVALQNRRGQALRVMHLTCPLNAFNGKNGNPSIPDILSVWNLNTDEFEFTPRKWRVLEYPMEDVEEGTLSILLGEEPDDLWVDTEETNLRPRVIASVEDFLDPPEISDVEHDVVTLLGGNKDVVVTVNLSLDDIPDDAKDLQLEFYSADLADLPTATQNSLRDRHVVDNEGVYLQITSEEQAAEVEDDEWLPAYYGPPAQEISIRGGKIGFNQVVYVRARYEYSGNRYGIWTQAWRGLTVGDLQPPGALTNLTATAGPQGVFINWTPPTDEDYKEAVLYVYETDTFPDTPDRVLYDKSHSFVDTDQQITVYAAAVDGTNNRGPWSGPVTAAPASTRAGQNQVLVREEIWKLVTGTQTAPSSRPEQPTGDNPAGWTAGQFSGTKNQYDSVWGCNRAYLPSEDSDMVPWSGPFVIHPIDEVSGEIIDGEQVLYSERAWSSRPAQPTGTSFASLNRRTDVDADTTYTDSASGNNWKSTRTADSRWVTMRRGTEFSNRRIQIEGTVEELGSQYSFSDWTEPMAIDGLNPGLAPVQVNVSSADITVLVGERVFWDATITPPNMAAITATTTLDGARAGEFSRTGLGPGTGQTRHRLYYDARDVTAAGTDTVVFRFGAPGFTRREITYTVHVNAVDNSTQSSIEGLPSSIDFTAVQLSRALAFNVTPTAGEVTILETISNMTVVVTDDSGRRRGILFVRDDLAAVTDETVTVVYTPEVGQPSQHNITVNAAAGAMNNSFTTDIQGSFFITIDANGNGSTNTEFDVSPSTAGSTVTIATTSNLITLHGGTGSGMSTVFDESGGTLTIRTVPAEAKKLTANADETFTVDITNSTFTNIQNNTTHTVTIRVRTGVPAVSGLDNVTIRATDADRLQVERFSVSPTNATITATVNPSSLASIHSGSRLNPPPGGKRRSRHITFDASGNNEGGTGTYELVITNPDTGYATTVSKDLTVEKKAGTTPPPDTTQPTLTYTERTYRFKPNQNRLVFTFNFSNLPSGFTYRSSNVLSYGLVPQTDNTREPARVISRVSSRKRGVTDIWDITIDRTNAGSNGWSVRNASDIPSGYTKRPPMLAVLIRDGNTTPASLIRYEFNLVGEPANNAAKTDTTPTNGSESYMPPFPTAPPTPITVTMSGLRAVQVIPANADRWTDDVTVDPADAVITAGAPTETSGDVPTFGGAANTSRTGVKRLTFNRKSGTTGSGSADFVITATSGSRSTSGNTTVSVAQKPPAPSETNYGRPRITSLTYTKIGTNLVFAAITNKSESRVDAVEIVARAGQTNIPGISQDVTWVGSHFAFTIPISTLTGTGSSTATRQVRVRIQNKGPVSRTSSPGANRWSGWSFRTIKRRDLT